MDKVEAKKQQENYSPSHTKVEILHEKSLSRRHALCAPRVNVELKNKIGLHLPTRGRNSKILHLCIRTLSNRLMTY